MAETTYTRLARSARRKGKIVEGLTTYSSLWLAGDHVLCINSNHYIEEYKRFYFRDIQTITIRRTRHREFLNFLLAILMLLFFAVVVSASGRIAPAIPMLLILAGLLVWNNALGPTCTGYVRTAVQVEEWPSLNRIRRAQRIISRIRPLISAAQGNITQDEAVMRIREIQSAQSAPAQQESRPAPASPLNLT